MYGHKYYIPSEYEQMLIAAGWVEMESLDVDYLDYARRVEDPMSYKHWVSSKREWDELATAYTNEIEPLYKDWEYTFTRGQEERERQLLKEMSWLEVLLGY